MKYRNTLSFAFLAWMTCASAAPAAHESDLTGIWMSPMAVHEIGIPLQGGVSQWAPLSAGDPRKQHVPTLEEAKKRGDMAAPAILKSTGDLTALMGPPKPPPFLTDTGLAAFKKFDRKVFETQDFNCYPFNVFTRLGGGLGPLQIVQNRHAIMMATAINGDNFPRVIFMDGRDDKKALPSWEGFSVGHWVGDTLHVRTTKIKGDFFNMGWPVGIHATLTEEYKIVGTGADRKLEILQTLNDPENYKEPVARVSYLDWRPDLLLQDFPCEEGKGDGLPEITESAK
jgi:hypothetical protein